MEPRTLDLAAYPRRAHFDYFRQMANPYVSVTAPCASRFMKLPQRPKI